MTYNWYSQILSSNVSAALFWSEQARPLVSMLEQVIGSYTGQLGSMSRFIYVYLFDAGIVPDIPKCHSSTAVGKSP